MSFSLGVAKQIKSLFLFLLMSGIALGQVQVSIDATIPNAFENGSGNGEFTIVLENASPPILLPSVYQVNLNISGTADNDVDYEEIQTFVNIIVPILQTRGEATIVIEPKEDFFYEDTENVILEILESPQYDIVPGKESASVAILDDDFPGILVNGINASAGPVLGTTTEDGSQDVTFLVTLDSEPTDDVIIQFDDYLDGEISGENSIVITPLEWQTGVPFTVEGVDDNIDDGDVITTIIANNVTSLDANYNAFTGTDVPQLEITNIDNDTAGFTLSPLSNDTEEDGTEARFTIVLNTEPINNDVVFELTTISDEIEIFNEAPVFTSMNWNTPQTIILTGQDDDIVDGNQIFTIVVAVESTTNDVNYLALPDQQVQGLNIDNDFAGYTVTPTILSTEESGTQDSFTIVLDARPENEVAFSLNVTSNEDEISLSDSSVVFNNTNWNQPRTINVTGLDDTVVDGNQSFEVSIDIDAANTDPQFLGLSETVVIGENLDNDVAGFVVNPNAVSTSETGSTAVISVVLTAQPLTDVIFTVNSSDEDEASVSPGSLIFTDLNWDEEQEIIVKGEDDEAIDGNQNFQIRIAIDDASSDVEFRSLNDFLVNGINNDNDVDCAEGIEPPVVDNNLSTVICDEESFDLDNFISNSAPSGFNLTWSNDSNPYNTGAHISSVVEESAVYYGFYYNNGGTPIITDDDCATAAIVINLDFRDAPEIESINGVTVCEGESDVAISVTATTGAQINWYQNLNDNSPLAQGTSFSVPAINQTTSFYAEAALSGCVSERVEVVVEVIPAPMPGTQVINSVCIEAGPDNTTLLNLEEVLEGEGTGNWSFVSGPSAVSISDDIVDFDGLEEGDYIFSYTTTGAIPPCVDRAIQYTLLAVNCFEDTDGDGLSDGEETNLGTNPTNADTDGDTINDGQEVLTDNTNPLDDCDSIGGVPLPDGDCDMDGLSNGEELELGSDPYDSCDPNLDSEACGADPVDIAITKTVNVSSPLSGREITFTITATNIVPETTAINVEVVDVLSNPTYFEVESVRSEVAGEAVGEYDILSGIWRIPELLGESTAVLTITGRVLVNERVSFTNTASLRRVSPRDNNSENDSATVSISVQLSDCVASGTICNQFSPNGDGVNDVLVLVNATDYPNSYLQIFNRYGTSVYEKRGYDNSWDGTGDNGELPKGTYFYVLDLGDGSDVTKGWIQIIR
ncbi:gliding motility-associated C-terminal domain-containing protein [Flavobacterium sp. ASW18X]|uniref:T9SS type B sorting domain-containing protein n=1 Tax=Flavobacterium sp. ASW18X TaxID=2572595 RepID=UPI00146B48F6|nr:gliding motility-associated C-terminal domain-containing protein [Flavobacterium sp. ASW18X]